MAEVRISRELARTQGGGNPACFSPRSAHYAIEGSRIRHRQKDFLLTPHGILRVPASRSLPVLAQDDECVSHRDGVDDSFDADAACDLLFASLA